MILNIPFLVRIRLLIPVFAQLTLWYWITKCCALPLGKQFFQHSAFFSFL